MIQGTQQRELISVKNGQEHMRITINEGCSPELQETLDKAFFEMYGGKNGCDR